MAAAFLLGHTMAVQPAEIHYEGKVYEFEAIKIEGVEHIHLEALASVLRCAGGWEPETKVFTIKTGEVSVRFLPDNPFILLNDSLTNIPLPPVLHEGRLLIPISVLARAIGKPLHKDFSWKKGAQVLTIGPAVQNIIGIRIGASVTFTQLTVETTRPLRFGFTVEEGVLNLEIEEGIFSEDLFLDRGKGLVDRISCEQLEKSARVKVALKPGIGKIDTLSSTEPPRIVLFLSKKAEKRPVKKEVSLRKTLLDPGHGGKDPGAVGPKGYAEKDANLAMAKVLKKKLEKLGVKVILTREDDSYVSLPERAEMANREQCDLFISVHCNSAPKKRTGKGKGVETYFLSEAKTDWARAVEVRENAAIRFEFPEQSLENLDPITKILSDMAQNEFLNESSHLAECIQVELGKRLPVEDRGVQQAGFYVLAGAYMPAVLVEVAFISNREEEKLLRQGWFRERAMEGVYWGVKRFKESYERKLSQ